LAHAALDLVLARRRTGGTPRGRARAEQNADRHGHRLSSHGVLPPGRSILTNPIRVNNPAPIRGSDWSAERAGKESVDRSPAVVPQEARTGAREMRMDDDGKLARLPGLPRPVEPGVLVLIEDVQPLVEELGVLGADAGAADHGFVWLDPPHEEDVLAVV